jgi:UDP-N-acetylmuramoyl-L-alanyl-D-glutamate--2,6-diaminopimelate ligase
VLGDLRRLRPEARLVVVFGCGGDRDQEKRPAMGAIAARYADEVVVTSDNPRSEDHEAIIDAIVAGAHGPGVVRREVDRDAAITSAILDAGDDDVVLVAGKGHETTQEVRGVFRPFDDRLVAEAALRDRATTC